MGAWGTGNFDNDTAADWALELESSSDLAFVEETISRVIDEGDEYLDSDLACEALAAIEVVARLRGNWGERSPYSEPVDKWVEENKLSLSQNIIDASLKAIEGILGENSELNELWVDTDDYEQWKSELNNLKERVVT